METPRGEAGRWAPWSALALIALTLAVYFLPAGGVARCGFVVDDREYIEHNRTLDDLDGLRRIWTDVKAMPHYQYYPAVLTSFWLENQLWGRDPLGYHVVNVLLQALNAVLIWRLLRRLAVPGAWLAAAVFAVHPIQVETVAWVTERKNLLYVAFWLGSALAYLRFAGDASKRRDYAVALVLFALAMVSKASAFSLPAALVLLLWLLRAGNAKRHALALTPFFALAIGIGGFSAWAERQYVGAQGEQWDETFLERVLIAGRALWFYAGKLLWPHPISFNYERWSVDTGALWQWAFPVLALALPLVLWRLVGRLGRGPLVAVLLFGGTLLPFLGFVNFFFMRYAYVADHLVYLASAAWIALWVALLARWTSPWSPNLRRALAALLLAVLGTLSARHVPAYESDETLWRDTIEKNPQAWVAHMLLGFELYARGAHDESIASYDRAIALTDGHPRARVTCMRGMTLLARGDLDEAIEMFRATLEMKPTHFDSHYHLAQALARKGRPQQAARHYTNALRVDPGHLPAMLELAELLLDNGDPAAAQQVLREALRRAPESEAAQALAARAVGG